MARRIVSPRAVRGVRRKTRWGSTVSTSVTTIAAATNVLFARFTAATLASELGAPFTVIRERGEFNFFSDQKVATESQLGAIGFAVVSEQAAAAGAASVPGPITNADWDGWYAWAPILGRYEIESAVGFESHFGHPLMLDSKAMRKVNDNESLVIMVENAHATHGFTIAYEGRTLFKLH